ncbi:hypothetical protein [uncultured Kiloniella sp.]|mgnify:CR=1 FL=1|uniref:hypothetical protein n=1 Tax=uncultured Kiloniella sp. TaxID=1133091 RepID=UPI00262ECB07|nr:hypothetical protein [uncultured Kiloniella sp.]
MLNCETLKDVVNELEPSLGQRIWFDEKEFRQLWNLLKDTSIRLEIIEQELLEWRNQSVSKVIELFPPQNIQPAKVTIKTPPDDAA